MTPQTKQKIFKGLLIVAAVAVVVVNREQSQRLLEKARNL